MSATDAVTESPAIADGGVAGLRARTARGAFVAVASQVAGTAMNLGFVAVLMGVAILLGTLTPYVLTIVFAILIDVMFIRSEERNLERKFGEDWHEYKHRVRRWL